MSETVRRAIAGLKDTKAGWVSRRDAADALGKIAQQALGALNEHRDEKDTDVRIAVDKALARAGTPPMPAPDPDHELDLEELARACDKPGKRKVRFEGKTLLVEAQIKDGRTQTVYVTPYDRKDGAKLLRVLSYCGAPTEKAQSWALNSNGKLINCAFAITKKGDKELLILVNNFDQNRATVEAVKSAVKEIAFYGDWLESKLTGLDDF